VFQRLSETGNDVEKAYQQNWQGFETGFWETEVSVGRLRYPRSALFLNHWLIARTGEEVVAREVFDRFKRYADNEAGIPMYELLDQLNKAAGAYRDFITAASTLTGPISRLALFGYRTSVLESEVIKPLVLCLLETRDPKVPDHQVEKALDVVESWMVRRMLVRATTKNYNQVFAELVGLVRANRATAGGAIESYFASQSSPSRYWPDDIELREETETLQAYRRLRRGRLRMVLEAVEDYERGWKEGKSGLADERVARGKMAIEHIMPRKWQPNWPLEDPAGEAAREGIIHTLGNLTLLTKRLNSKVSNAQWLGTNGKREGLEQHDVLFLNRGVLRIGETVWTDEAIRSRTVTIAKVIVQIWPVPPNHRSEFARKRPSRQKRIDLSDLIAGGVLHAGMSLFPRHNQFAHRTVTLLSDGRIEVDGIPYLTPFNAASAIVGKRTNGWWFFLTDQAAKRSLRNVRRDYIEEMDVDAEDDEADDGDDDDV